MKSKRSDDRRAVSALLLLLLCAVGLCCAGLAGKAATDSAVVEERANADKLQQRLQERYAAASTLLKMEEERLRAGVTTLGHVCEVARWLRDSALELPSTAPGRRVALTNYAVMTKRLEQSVERAVQTGMAPPLDRESARYLRLDAGVTLLRAGIPVPNDL